MLVEGIRGSIGLTPAQLGETKVVLPSDGSPAGTSAIDGASAVAPKKEVSFEDLLAGAIDNANSLSHTADAKAEALSRGTLDDIHGTMIAAKEAEISLHLVGTIRNRLLDAFHELWRTSV
jgi:flagellar hook-basal body complex protein FliE